MKKKQFTFKSPKGRIIILLSVFIAVFSLSGFGENNSQKGNQAPNAPVFTKFVYQGNDKVYNDFPPDVEQSKICSHRNV